MPYKHDRRGFAVVEVLLMLVILSILAAVVIMAIVPRDRVNPAAACRAEARTFENAVQAYHRAHNNQAWPDNNLNNIQVVNMTLHLFGDLRGDHTLDHLDGSQRKPATDAKGWTYDFKRHTAVPVNCADAR